MLLTVATLAALTACSSESGEEETAVPSTSTEITTDDQEQTESTVGEVPETQTTAESTPEETTTSSATSTETSDGIQLSGVITEVFNDCDSLWVLTDGEPTKKEGAPITCDGGSWIKVGATQIRTTSGFTVRELSYDRHTVDGERPMPGMTVIVRAIDDGSGQLSLDCLTCGISLA